MTPFSATTVILASAVAAELARPADPAGFVARPAARVATEPTKDAGDSYDDPAVWLHPTDPAKSLILGTNKKGGLHAFDMDGREVQVVTPGCLPDNVDVMYGFPLRGRPTDIAVAGCRQKGKPCVRVWAIDADTGRLAEVTGPDGIAVFGGGVPYGSCTYHSRATGRFYFFVNHKSGKYEQYVLGWVAGGRVDAVKVREFAVGSVAEGCVADDETGALYVAEEDVGVWRFSAEETGGDSRTLIAKVGENGLKDDVEGVTIYSAAGGKGYLIVSSQGNNTFKLYDRGPGNRFVGTIDPAQGTLGGTFDTDGIAVANRPTSARFPKGVFVAQDGVSKEAGNRKQSFKLFAWDEIAGGTLLVDPAWSPRR
jgi:3-phytase